MICTRMYYVFEYRSGTSKGMVRLSSTIYTGMVRQ
jgi:hypothetical protein